MKGWYNMEYIEAVRINMGENINCLGQDMGDILYLDKASIKNGYGKFYSIDGCLYAGEYKVNDFKIITAS